MSADEARLIQRAKRGDSSAFAEIYDRCQPAIYRYVFYQVGGDASTAEDLTGEVFVRLVERIDLFTYRGRPMLAWLYTIARNLVTDHHRRSGRIPTVDLDEVPTASAVNIESVIENRLTQARLATAMADLTDDQRQVIIMKFIEGMSNEAVARMLGKSVGAVKSLQHRALAALQRILEQNGTERDAG